MDLKVSSVSLPGIETYIEKKLESRKDVFKKAELLAKEINAPIVGPQVGNFLSLITAISSASKVLELGSSIGYSTLWFADAVGEKGKVVYTDFDHKNAEIAKTLSKESNLFNRIDFYVGDALDYVANTSEEFDIIFIDLDKSMYVEALEKSISKLKVGGVLIADNTLWAGRVRWEQNDLNTKTIKKYNEIVSSHPLFQTGIIPLRDGITISYKTGN